jgi:hypothetical protein
LDALVDQQHWVAVAGAVRVLDALTDGTVTRAHDGVDLVP